MFNFLLSPFAKLLGAGLVVTLLIAFGYYKGYTSEHEKLLAYKAQIQAQVEQQEELNKSIAKQQEIKTEGIINEYKAKLIALRSSTSRVQYNPSTVQLSQTKGTQGTVTAPSYPVLVGQCLETTLMLNSLQDWVSFISE